MTKSGFRWIIVGCVVSLAACGDKHATTKPGDFTHLDSLTETYLMLQDTMLQSWNVMMKDENEKIHSMHELIHFLLASQVADKDQLVSLEQRLDQLERIRFTQKTMSSPHVVEEYDFASNSLISELISLAESDPGFSENEKLTAMVDRIRTADQRVDIYREEYDAVVIEFNEFLESNKDQIKEIDQNITLEQRPLFGVADED